MGLRMAMVMPGLSRGALLAVAMAGAIISVLGGMAPSFISAA